MLGPRITRRLFRLVLSNSVLLPIYGSQRRRVCSFGSTAGKASAFGPHANAAVCWADYVGYGDNGIVILNGDRDRGLIKL